MKNFKIRTQKDLIELLDVDHTDLQWCYEVCKGIGHLRRVVGEIKEAAARGKLNHKFREAKRHFECAKCGIHNLELADSEFIFCDLSRSATHGTCSGLDLDSEEIKNLKFL